MGVPCKKGSVVVQLACLPPSARVFDLLTQVPSGDLIQTIVVFVRFSALPLSRPEALLR